MPRCHAHPKARATTTIYLVIADRESPPPKQLETLHLCPVCRQFVLARPKSDRFDALARIAPRVGQIADEYTAPDRPIK